MQVGKLFNLHPFRDFWEVPGRASGDLGGLRGVSGALEMDAGWEAVQPASIS